jgi:hypothetical protein
MRHSLRRPRTRQCLLFATIALTIVSLTAPAQAAPVRSQNLSDTSPVQLRDGVIVDLARDVAYVMGRDGGIDALRASDGAVLWSSDEAAKPLAAFGDMLIAQAETDAPGELPLVALDRGTGATVSKSRVALPDGVWATVSDRPRASFKASAQTRDDGVMVLWRSQRLGDEDFQGYIPSGDEGRSPGAPVATRSEIPAGPRVTTGSAMLDPRSGSVSPMAAKAAGSTSQHLTLRAYDGLAGVEGRQFLSADGRHVLVSRSLGARELLDRYEWSVYTRAGDLVGTVKSSRSAAPFLVSGSSLLFEASPYFIAGENPVDEPLRVVSIDLATGVTSWTKAVRSTDFAGPFPP